MLNEQRERYLKNRSEVNFTRRLVLAILCTAWIAPAMMILDDLSFWSLVMMIWLLMTLGLVPGLLEGNKWNCVSMGVLCIAGGGVVIGIVTMVGPVEPLETLEPSPLGLDRPYLPYWAWVWSPAYVVLGCTLIFSQRVDRAVTRYLGF